MCVAGWRSGTRDICSERQKPRRAATDLRQAYTNNLLLRSTVTLAANNSAKTPTNSGKKC